jgi:hypothetical protein
MPPIFPGGIGVGGSETVNHHTTPHSVGGAPKDMHNSDSGMNSRSFIVFFFLYYLHLNLFDTSQLVWLHIPYIP